MAQAVVQNHCLPAYLSACRSPLAPFSQQRRSVAQSHTSVAQSQFTRRTQDAHTTLKSLPACRGPISSKESAGGQRAGADLRGLTGGRERGRRGGEESRRRKLSSRFEIALHGLKWWGGGADLRRDEDAAENLGAVGLCAPHEVALPPRTHVILRLGFRV